MLDFDFEDIDCMDDDAGDEQEPLPTGHRTPTSSYDVYMVDTPKENDDEERKIKHPGKSQKGGANAAQSLAIAKIATRAQEGSIYPQTPKATTTRWTQR